MIMRTLLLSLALFTATGAHALNQFLQDVPNGTTFRCLTCHQRSGGGNPWNAFGQAILIKGGANPDANPNSMNDGFEGRPSDYWPDLCDDDSDDDGATNAEELGDLDCDGEADDGLIASNPGDPDSVPDDPGPAEGEGEGESPVGCAASPNEPVSLLAFGLVALLRRRRS